MDTEHSWAPAAGGEVVVSMVWVVVFVQPGDRKPMKAAE